MINLAGKTALVTGGGQGIGRGIALSLAQAQVNVAVADIDLEKANAVAGEVAALGLKSLAIQADVTKEDQVRSMVEQTVAGLGSLDIAVNNAGVLGIAFVTEMTEAEWDRIMDVNVKGVFLCTKAEVGYMLGRGAGRIINVSSSAGKMGIAFLSHYCASKFAVIGFSNSVAKEVAANGITVNVVCPGILGTDMWLGPNGLAAALKSPEETIEESFERNLKALIPQGTSQTPEDIGQAVVYLAAADHVTGQALSVDGGLNNP